MDPDRTTRQVQLWNETQEWIKENPELFARFEELALEKASNQERFGIAALTERVRWDWKSHAKKKSMTAEFKVSNSYRRYIALELIQRHPWIEKFCTTKMVISLPEPLIGSYKPELVEDAVVSELFGE